MSTGDPQEGRGYVAIFAHIWAISDFFPGLRTEDPQEGMGEVATSDFFPVHGTWDPREGKGYVVCVQIWAPETKGAR